MRPCSVVPNDAVLRFYFYFIQERMNVFWNRCERKSKLTDDPILQKYKFTNVYRACDRVSQYLINRVIYRDFELYSPQDVLLRILVFKIFNKPETWEYIQETYGEITMSHFEVSVLSRLLSKRQQKVPIFNNAYMMTGTHHLYDTYSSKHEKWLTMVKREVIEGGVLDKILQAQSLRSVYEVLNQCSFLGSFLSYQYAIDFNYTPYLNFDENSFVKAGIGAIRGIKKCFVSYGAEYEDAIRYVQKNFKELQIRYGYTSFRPLPGRMPTLLDLQNCFCETDKYLRQAMPELRVDNSRIKQVFKASRQSIHYAFPPQWNISGTFVYLPQQPVFSFNYDA